jgi:hypothetical protein
MLVSWKEKPSGIRGRRDMGMTERGLTIRLPGQRQYAELYVVIVDVSF